jgi:hypothetical protein
MFRIVLLLGPILTERSQSGDDPNGHESHRDKRPDQAPALRGAAVAICEDAGIRRVDFAQDEIVADIPHAIERGHYADEQLPTTSGGWLLSR